MTTAPAALRPVTAQRGLIAQLTGAAAAAGAIALLASWAGQAPAPTPPPPAWTGRIGPPKLTVAIKPAAAGAPAQAITLTFTRPRTGAAYDVLHSVRARLTPKALAISPPGLAPGGSVKPLKAAKTGPGVWTLALAGDQRVALPGTWTLRLSASPKPGQAFRRSIPVTFG